jgi:hypothetical protein
MRERRNGFAQGCGESSPPRTRLGRTRFIPPYSQLASRRSGNGEANPFRNRTTTQRRTLNRILGVASPTGECASRVLRLLERMGFSRATFELLVRA